MSYRRSKPHYRSQSNSTPQPALPQPSDIETDTPISIPPTPPKRNIADLNLSVLRRHCPSVTQIICISPYVIVYTYTPDANRWQKIEMEGTLFVCALTPSPIGAERFCVIILNRRGMNNFFVELKSPEEISSSGDYLLVQGENAENVVNGPAGETRIYGIWIYSEEESSSNHESMRISMEIMKNCAERAELSRKDAEERIRREEEAAARANGEQEMESNGDLEVSVPMGRQLSLRQLFGRQRDEDAGWSVHDHHSPAVTAQYGSNVNTPTAPPQNDILQQLFMNARRN